ncbi:MAG: acylneuraminate cytidylyltransferase family protein [Candidatus Omnitrophica bacterium]|nr:acylneuraminate cytidylyltransferase family protein [Candidatus Omnitrophota bacterium]
MILGVIPARGGSKGIPRKNIKMIAGKPLIAWTIEAAQEATLLDRFVVSTEDEEIEQISKERGAEVIKRPTELATDEASTLSVLQHTLSLVDADAIVLLQPTSPIRNKGRIDACIKEYQQKRADNLATGFICKYMEYGTCNQRRQDIEGFFHNDGNVCIISSGLIKSGKIFGGDTARVIITREENAQIDDDFDFWVMEHILMKRIKEARQNAEAKIS